MLASVLSTCLPVAEIPNTTTPTQETLHTATYIITTSTTTTNTPKPTIDYFKDAKILNIGFLGNNLLLIVLELSTDLEGDYLAKIGDEEFQCEILDD
jgi:hypothetical protein